MKTVYYSRIKLVILALLSLLLLCGGVWMWLLFDGKGAFIGGLAIIIMPLVFCFALRYLVDNTIATLGQNSFEYRGLLGSKNLAYSQITNINIETTSVSFISHRNLIVKAEGSSPGKAKFIALLLEKSAGNLEGIINAIVSASEEPEQQARPARRLENPSLAFAPNPAAQRAHGFGRRGL